MIKEGMTHRDKIDWMAKWAAKHRVTLELESECGFGRECVGIMADGLFPDWTWSDDETLERLDNNGDVWTPEDAYHKHPCVAVLGRGMKAESQLYDWLKWFDDNGFSVEAGILKRDKPYDYIEILWMKHKYARMFKK